MTYDVVTVKWEGGTCSSVLLLGNHRGAASEWELHSSSRCAVAYWWLMRMVLWTKRIAVLGGA